VPKWAEASHQRGHFGRFMRLRILRLGPNFPFVGNVKKRDSNRPSILVYYIDEFATMLIMVCAPRFNFNLASFSGFWRAFSEYWTRSSPMGVSARYAEAYRAQRRCVVTSSSNTHPDAPKALARDSSGLVKLELTQRVSLLTPVPTHVGALRLERDGRVTLRN
jgi:hypothetical protein